MKLMTQKIKQAFVKQGDTSQLPAKEIPVICKFFDPTGTWTYYAYEFDGEDILTGYCISPYGAPYNELGDTSLTEILATKGRFGIGMERDTAFKIGSMTVAEVVETIKGGGRC
jgi:hypothetical protein